MTIQQIIDRAKQISDMVNCDFLTTAELVSIINEQLYKVYCDLISINDKYFCERVTFNDRVTLLPDKHRIILSSPTFENTFLTAAFYKLEDIYEELNGYREPLQRLSPNAQPNTKGYELLGDSLYLYNIRGKVVMTYYTKPHTYAVSELNTEITMPSNVLIQYLEYLVAQQMKCKQGADFTQIMASAATLFDSYAKSIDRDVHDYETVRNIYAKSFRRYVR